MAAAASRGAPVVVDTNGTAMAVRDEQRGLTQADPEHAAGALAHILATGDLAKLSNEQRVAHYLNQCDSLGLNPISRPFDWLILDGKLVLYPNKSCAEQLRRNHQISVKVTRREIVGDLFCVEVEGRTPSGRTDEASKYVPLKNGRNEKLSGALLANAFAKAETGAKRRLVMSMVGLSSPPDPDEVRGARIVVVDGTGRVLEHPTQEQKALAADPDMARVLKEPTYETTAQAADAPLSGHASQAPRIDEIDPPKPAREKVSLYCDADRWRGAFFAAVEDTDLETAAGRRAFLAEYTSGFAPALRTDSLSEFLAHASERQASDMVAVAGQEADALRDALRDLGDDSDSDDAEQLEAF